MSEHTGEDRGEDRRDLPHEEVELVGAWLLGGLEPAEAERLEAHLATCATCRDEADGLRDVAAMLREVDPDDVRPVGVTPPAALDARIEAALAGSVPAPAPEPAPESGPESGPEVLPLARRPRRRLWAAGVGGLVVGAAAASLLVATTTGGADSPPPTAAPVVTVDDLRSSSGVTASAGYVDHTWGLEIKLKARGLPAGKAFAVEVIDAQGRTYDAGAFLGVAADKTVDCDVNASVLSDDADRFVVTGPKGTTLIEGDLHT